MYTTWWLGAILDFYGMPSKYKKCLSFVYPIKRKLIRLAQTHYWNHSNIKVVTGIHKTQKHTTIPYLSIWSMSSLLFGSKLMISFIHSRAIAWSNGHERFYMLFSFKLELLFYYFTRRLSVSNWNCCNP